MAYPSGMPNTIRAKGYWAQTTARQKLHEKGRIVMTRPKTFSFNAATNADANIAIFPES